MSTYTLASALEPIFAEEGSSESAVTARFVKVAGIFAQYPDNTIDDVSDLIKSDEVRRLALGGWLLHQFGVTKENKTAVYNFAQLGKVEAYRSVKGATSITSAQEAYKKAVKRITKKAQAKRQERNTSGDTGNALLKTASRLDSADIVLVVNEANDDYIKALEAVIKRYKAIKTSNKVKAVLESAPEPALV